MISGHFIDSQGGKVFVTQFGDASSDKSVLILPSLFEELNLCRAVVAKQAQKMATNGAVVYCLDYYGCGDSEGEIEQANVQIWQQNIIDTLEWIKGKGAGTIDLWAIRFGALLAMNTLEHWAGSSVEPTILMWKPVLKGKQFMTQFLRLKQANSMMQGTEKVNWREKILSGETTEVAGYEITAELLSSIDKLAFPTEIPDSISVHWFELAAKSITPAVIKQTSTWCQDRIHLQNFEGSAFWAIPEIFSQPELQSPSLVAFDREIIK